MFYFALTRKSYDDLVTQFGQPPSPLWVNNRVLSATEIKRLHAAGVDISNFTIDVNPQDPSDVAQAVDTIKEHHPGQTVWVEHADGL